MAEEDPHEGGEAAGELGLEVSAGGSDEVLGVCSANEVHERGCMTSDMAHNSLNFEAPYCRVGMRYRTRSMARPQNTREMECLHHLSTAQSDGSF
jgi:hypothetical protein